MESFLFISLKMTNTLHMQEFEVVARKLFTEDGKPDAVGQAALRGMRSHVYSACHSSPNGKYSDYSEEQINVAFANCNLLFEMYVPDPLSHVKIPAGLALVNVMHPVATIKLLFTLPGGKGHMLISRLIGYSKNVFAVPEIDKIVCHSHNFVWISGPCSTHRFTKATEEGVYEYRTNVLHFNQHPIVKLDAVPELAAANTDTIKSEPSFEHAPYSSELGGPLYSGFIQHLINRSIITREELSRSRSDVRVTVLRPGQSSNPPGIHGDFTPREPITGYFCNPPPQETLKIVIVSVGKPGTRVYTKPVDLAICTDEWTHLWREDRFDSAVQNEHFDTDSACPVVFSEMQLHEARALSACDMSLGETASVRVFMRLIIYPESRRSEVPKCAAQSLPQVYLKEVEMKA